MTLVTWSHLGAWDILERTNLGSAVQNMKAMFSHNRPQINVWLLLFDLSQITLFLACPMWKGLIFRSHLVYVVVSSSDTLFVINLVWLLLNLIIRVYPWTNNDQVSCQKNIDLFQNYVNCKPYCQLQQNGWCCFFSGSCHAYCQYARISNNKMNLLHQNHVKLQTHHCCHSHEYVKHSEKWFEVLLLVYNCLAGWMPKIHFEFWSPCGSLRSGGQQVRWVQTKHKTVAFVYVQIWM